MTTKLTALSDLEQASPGEVPLPTVPVLARFRSTAPDAAAAVTDVVGRIAPVREMHDDIVVERREDDGSFWVVARFVTVSVDTHTAVLGVHDTLVSAGLEVDEVWVQG
jgi:hypothetical protein